LPTLIFLKQFLANRTNGTLGFARHTSQRFAKPKEPFFSNTPEQKKCLPLQTENK